MNTIQTYWEELARTLCIDGKPQGIRYIELRRAFYAGAHAALTIMNYTAQETEREHITDEAGVAILAGMEDEIIQFAKQVGKTV